MKPTLKSMSLRSHAAPFAIRSERASDVTAREALLDACFGANRQSRTCHRLRDGRVPAEGLALSVVLQGRLVGTVRCGTSAPGASRRSCSARWRSIRPAASSAFGAG